MKRKLYIVLEHLKFVNCIPVQSSDYEYDTTACLGSLYEYIIPNVLVGTSTFKNYVCERYVSQCAPRLLPWLGEVSRWGITGNGLGQ